MKALEIQKYGGTSMADAEAMMQSAQVVARSRETGKSNLVIVSAMSGVTEQLRNAVNAGITGRDHWSIMRDIGGRHSELIERVVEPNEIENLEKVAQQQFLKAHEFIEAMRTLKMKSPLHYDWISSLGERLITPVLVAHLQSSGIDAVHYNASEVMITDDVFGNANPLISSIREKSAKSNLINDLNKGRFVIMGGYHGTDINGNITTFSRGGSDLSATVMGHALTTVFDPISVYLYKADVAGVMSADPRIVNNAHVVSHMFYEEAAALTALGGKVIHPKAIHHAIRSGSSKRDPFPIYVKSTTRPEDLGTVIDNKVRSDDYPVKAISVIKSAVRLEIRGWGMDRPGIMREITGALAGRGLDIDFIAQPHSKLVLDLAFQFDGKEVELEELVRDGLMDEIKRNDIDMIIANRVGVIGVIGNGLSDPIILRKVIDGMNGDFSELKRPNAYKLTTGSFEASILVNLPEKRLEELAQSIHDSVFSD